MACIVGREPPVAPVGPATTNRAGFAIVSVMSLLFALTTDSAKSAALVVVLVLVGIAVVSALVIKAIVTKILSLAICGLLSLGMFSQRASITNCADKVKSGALSTHNKTECSFFGIKVSVPTDRVP